MAERSAGVRQRRFDRGADFLGAAALDDGGHLTGGGILDRNAVGPGIRGPSER